LATIEITAQSVNIDILILSATSVTVYIDDVSDVAQLGAVLDLEPENITDTMWVDASPNGLHGTVSGAIANRFVPSYSSRNYIINGAFDFAQRIGTGNSDSLSGSAPYGLDRWFQYGVFTGGGTVRCGLSSEVPNALSKWSMSLTAINFNLAAISELRIAQGIELGSIRHLAGKNITLSFWIRSAKTGSHAVRFSQAVGGVIDRLFTVNTANTWEQKSITVKLNSTLGTGTDTDQGLGVYIGLNIASLTGQTTLNIGEYIYIAQVMLNEGPVAAPFERAGGSIGGELELCERYFQQFYSSLIATYPSMRPEVVVPNSIYANFPLRTRMRPTASPVLYTNSPVLGVDYLVVNLAGAAQSGFTLNASIQASECHVRFQLDKTTHGLTDAAVLINSTKIGVSAEL
jgi:hypothetical protein